ncbi:MAG: SNF2-related protein [Candidatus Gastranaerophilaceae bacterium]
MKTDYHAKYLSYDLTKRCSSETVEKFVKTLSEAQVQLNPHQIDAALFAFRSPLSKGAILADEVGLGKTIEAGIVISQYWAERKRKILIIMPSSLRKQWQQELEDKFFIGSKILEAKSFNDEIKRGNLNPFEQEQIVICSYNFARNKVSYIKAIDWDLVVIDEAHRLRNVYKSSNKIANAIKEALVGKNKILLTATPLQNSLLELYGLVSIVDDYTFGDLPSFKAQYCRNGQQVDFKELKSRISPICQRTLRKQVLEYIKYTNRIAITEEFYPTQEEHDLYIGLSEYLQRDRLYALPQSQRKLMTLILRRLLASSTFAITGTLGGLAEKLQNLIDNNKAEDSTETELQGNIENYDEIKEEWIDDEETDFDNESSQKEYYTPDEVEQIKEEKFLLENFYKLARKIAKNAKGEKLLTALEKGFSENAKNGGTKKALIFTESTRTQQYLYEILSKTKYKDKIVLFNGSNNDEQSKAIYKKWFEKYKGTDKISGSKTADKRAALVEYFRDEAEIMIATEAAAEGINLQFCSLLVNYDLPWNPQRIEQRIGRCHRYGQKHDVVVVNFLNTKNAADVRVFELLSEKFKLFDGVFGASDEVLGAIGSGIDFEKRIAEILQSCRTEEEINQCFDELQQTMEADIDEKMLDTRKKLLENFDAEVAQKLKLSKDSTEKYLDKFEQKLWDLTKYYLNDYADFDDNSKYFMLNKNPFPELKINRGPYRLGKNIEDANTYRVSHPLAQRIFADTKSKNLPIQELVFDYTNNKTTKITILEDLIGKSGWLTLKNLTVDSFEKEDYLIFAGYQDDGEYIDYEQCEKLFMLGVQEMNKVSNHPDYGRLNTHIEARKSGFMDLIAQRNVQFFDDEMTKLDKWAEDRKNSLEIELKQLDKDIKTLKTESKKILKLEDKLNAQKTIKEMEAKRNKMRRELFESQDLVDKQKEDLIEKIEAKLNQKISEEELFTIRWRLI